MRDDAGGSAPSTRLGRAVRATANRVAIAREEHRERHRRTNSLRDVILGGQDGLVNILGIILGVIAGGGSNTVLLAAGFAVAITESISLGAVGYTSAVSQRDRGYHHSQPGQLAGHDDGRGTAPAARADGGHLSERRRDHHRYLIGHLIRCFRSCGSLGRRR
jgi:hypothetical protein